MKSFEIEESIIAYFDGRLTDDESAELLHRVSVSPEIRQLFREHATLRQLAERAARNVSVRPEVEEAIFARVAALQEAEEQESEKAALAPFADQATVPEAISDVRLDGVTRFGSIRKWASVAILLGTLSATALLFFSSLGHNDAKVHSTQNSVAPTQPSAESLSTLPSVSTTPTQVSSTLSPSVTSRGSVTSRPSAVSRLSRTPNATANTLSQNSSLPTEQRISLSTLASSATDVATDVIAPGNASIGEPLRLPLSSLRERDDESRFEIGIEGSSGFTSPALPNYSSANPLADARLHLAYQLGAHDQIGIRLIDGLFVTPRADITRTNDFVSIVSSSSPERKIAEEMYYAHRLDLDNGRFFIDAGAGLGLIPNGNLVTAELGLKIPVAANMLAGFTFTLARVHSNAPSATDLMSQESLPVLVAGPDIHNTLNGRIEYGLSYRF